VFTKRVHRLKQRTIVILHDENCAAFVVSLVIHKMVGREGVLIRGGAYFKFRPIGGALIMKGRLFKGGGALIRGFTVLKSYILYMKEALTLYTPNNHILK